MQEKNGSSSDSFETEHLHTIFHLSNKSVITVKINKVQIEMIQEPKDLQFHNILDREFMLIMHSLINTYYWLSFTGYKHLVYGIKWCKLYTIW